MPDNSGGAASNAAAMEINLRGAIGGCWDEAEPGAADGSFRQDYHYRSGRQCGGGGWDIDIQLFGTPSEARAAAARLHPTGLKLVSGYSLIVVATTASEGTRQAVRRQRGVLLIG